MAAFIAAKRIGIDVIDIGVRDILLVNKKAVQAVLLQDVIRHLMGQLQIIPLSGGLPQINEGENSVRIAVFGAHIELRLYAVRLADVPWPFAAGDPAGHFPQFALFCQATSGRRLSGEPGVH